MVAFPNESTDYRSARNKLLSAELELRAQVERVAALRRALPAGGSIEKDYTFTAHVDGNEVTKKFSELFAQNQNTLFVYSFMFAETPCPMCTTFMDGLNGQLPLITQNISAAVIAKNDVKVLDAYAKQRGWNNVEFLGSKNNTFNEDYFAETNGGQNGMAHIFVKQGNDIHHSWSSEMHFAGSIEGGNPRHVDQLWPLWNVLDLTPEGRGQWFPSLEY